MKLETSFKKNVVSCVSRLALELSACLGYLFDYILVTWARESAPIFTGLVVEALNSLIDLCYSRITVSSTSKDLRYPSAGDTLFDQEEWSVS